MIGTLDDAVTWGQAPVDIGGSLVRNFLEDALIDVDGPVQQLSPPEGGVPACIKRVLRSPSPSADVPYSLGIGGAVYAKVLQEVSQDSPPRVITEPHPEPSPAQVSPIAAHQPDPAVSPTGNRELLERRLCPPLAPPPSVPGHPASARKFRARPPAAAAALVAAPTAPNPAFSSPPPARNITHYRAALPSACAAAGWSPVNVQARDLPARTVDCPERPGGEHQKPFEEQSRWIRQVGALAPPISSFGEDRLSSFSGASGKAPAPVALGTHEVLQGALEEPAAELVGGKLPELRSLAPPLSGRAKKSVLYPTPDNLYLPAVQGAQAQDIIDAPLQERTALVPLRNEQPERNGRATPLYLRMQRCFEEKEQQGLVAAQDRRRAEMAGLEVFAVPAPMVLRRRRPRRFLVPVKKVKALGKRHVRTKKKVAANVVDVSSNAIVMDSAKTPSETTAAVKAAHGGVNDGKKRHNLGKAAKSKTKGAASNPTVDASEAGAKLPLARQTEASPVPEVEETIADSAASRDSLRQRVKACFEKAGDKLDPAFAEVFSKRKQGADDESAVASLNLASSLPKAVADFDEDLADEVDETGFASARLSNGELGGASLSQLPESETPVTDSFLNDAKQV